MSAKLVEFTVVSVPFPFTDRAKAKRRPALVLSSASEFNHVIGHSVMAMITSAVENPWPYDTAIVDFKSAGLSVACVLRFKLFLIDNRLVIRKAGKLGKADRESVRLAMSAVLGE